MATANQNAQGLVLALFNAAAGGNLANLAPLATTASAANSLGSNLVAVAALVTGKNLSDNTTFRDTLLANLQITSTNAAYANAKAWVDGQLATPGTDKGSIAGTAVTYLLSLTDATNPYYAAAKTFQTRTDTAVTWSTSTAGSAVLSATALIAQQASVDNYVAPPPPPVGVTTVALTTANDVIAGTSADEVVTGRNSNLVSAQTLNTTDKIDGGTGANKLQVTMDTSWNGFTTGTVTNVQTIELTNVGAQALTFNGTGITGATAYIVTNSGPGGTDSLNNLSTGVKTITLNSQSAPTSATATTFTTAFATGSAELTGTTDAVTFNINGVGTKARTSSAAPQDVQATLNSFETVNLGVTGTNFLTLQGTDLINLNISGAGTVTIDSVPTSTTSIDASALTGGLTINASNASAGALTKLAGGSGVNNMTVDAAKLRSTATITSGSGTTDKLILNSSAAVIGAYTTSGVETLALNNISGGTVSISGSKISGLTTVTVATKDVAGSSTNTNGVQQPVLLSSMGSGDLTFTDLGTVNAAGDVTSDNSGAVTINYNAEKTAAVTDHTSADAPANDFTLSKATSVVVNVNAYTAPNTAALVTADAANTVTVNVASGKDVAGTTELTLLQNKITSASATSFTVNATGGLRAGAEIAFAKATNGTVVFGTDTTTGALTLTTPLLSTLSITAGNDIVVTGSTNANNANIQSLTIAANRGLTKVTDGNGNLESLNSLNVTGTGTLSTDESAVLLIGDIGQTTNGYDLTIVGSGLKGNATNPGLIIGGVANDQTGDGKLVVAAGYNVTVDVKGVTGITKFSDVASTGTKANNVTIDATGSGGIQMGSADIFATGDVVFKASGTTNASTVDTITGNNVTVDLSASKSGSSFGAITAKTSANLTFNEGGNGNTSAASITAASGSTSLTVTVNGSATDDTVTVTGVSTDTLIKISGNLSGGTDQLIVKPVSNTTSVQRIDISGATGYETSNIYSTSSSKGEVIVGGDGKDTIFAVGQNDDLTGGKGADVFVFNAADSALATYSTIEDFSKADGDQIVYGSGNISLKTTTAATYDLGANGVNGKLSLSAYGVATFDLVAASTLYDTLTKKVQLINEVLTTAGQTALFKQGNDTFMFIDTDGANTAGSSTGVLIKLVGVPLPTAAETVGAGVNNMPTGLSGFGA